VIRCIEGETLTFCFGVEEYNRHSRPADGDVSFAERAYASGGGAAAVNTPEIEGIDGGTSKESSEGSKPGKGDDEYIEVAGEVDGAETSA
jgi:hypothetical protein